MKLTKKQIKFENRVLAWKCLAGTFGGWGKAAGFFKIKKAVLIRYVLDDLDQTWGSKLNWKDAFK